jgi:hypothetical protein
VICAGGPFKYESIMIEQLNYGLLREVCNYYWCTGVLFNWEFFTTLLQKCYYATYNLFAYNRISWWWKNWHYSRKYSSLSVSFDRHNLCLINNAHQKYDKLTFAHKNRERLTIQHDRGNELPPLSRKKNKSPLLVFIVILCLPWVNPLESLLKSTNSFAQR